MAPLRRRRFPANRKPKVDHSSYVQSLFREFLQRNQAAAAKPAPIAVEQRPTIREDVNRRSNPYRESIERMLQQQQQFGTTSDSVQEQQSMVRQFFQLGKTNQPEKGPQRMGPPEPVYARFKRREGSDQFVKRDLSPGGAPAGGLIQWLENRKRERLEREQRQQNRTKKADEYLNLPDNFFSGRASIKLPFELEPEASSSAVANKTLASLTSAFVPPVASTPLDRLPIDCSPIISDPDEIPAAKKDIMPKPKLVAKREDLELLKKLNSAFDSFGAILAAADGGITPLDRNYAELRRLRTSRPILPKPFPIKSEDNTSMVVQVQLGCDGKQQFPPPASVGSGSDTMSAAGDSTFEREVMQLVGMTPVKKKKRVLEVDPLLTYSPPMPKLDPDLELPPVAPRHEPNVTLNTTFLTNNGSLSSPGEEPPGSQPNDDTSMVIRVQLGGDRRRPGQATVPPSSVSYLDSTFAREVLQLTVPNEVRLRQVDPLLLYSPPYPRLEPEKKQICHREPDFSFLDSSRKLTRSGSILSVSQASQESGSCLGLAFSAQKQSEFAFDDDQENFGPIFPSQDGVILGGNTTINSNESLTVEDPFELRFSQGSVWERI